MKRILWAAVVVAAAQAGHAASSLLGSGMSSLAVGFDPANAVFTSSVAWTGGRVWYVPLGASIQDAINRATSGDVIELAAGTYTVTSTIDITKSLMLRGQGRGETFIYCTITVPVQISASNVTVSDLAIHNAYSGSSLSAGITTISGIRHHGILLERLDIYVLGGTGPIYGVRGRSHGVTINDCYMYAAHSGASADTCRGVSYSGGSVNNTINIINSRIEAYGNNTWGMGLDGYCSTTSTTTINIYNCHITGGSIGGTPYGRGISNDGTAGNCAYVNVYDSVINGYTNSVATVDAERVRLHCTVLHGSVSGVPLSSGTIHSAQGRFYGPVNQVVIGTHTASTNTIRLFADSVHSGGVVNAQGNGFIASSTGTAIYGRTYFPSTATLVFGTYLGAVTTSDLLASVPHGSASNTKYIGNASINVTAPSDERTKLVLGAADAQQVLKLYRLPVQRYKYKAEYNDDGGVVHTGFIAQDVQRVWPEAVTQRPDGLLAVHRDELIPPMLALIQRQKTEIDELRRRVTELERRLGK